MNKALSFLILAAALVLSGCAVDQKDMARLMRQEGVTEWKPTGKEFFLCANDSLAAQGFTGTKNGQPVRGVVCGGPPYAIRYW
jgi:hypothetical protein